MSFRRSRATPPYPRSGPTHEGMRATCDLPGADFQAQLPCRLAQSKRVMPLRALNVDCSKVSVVDLRQKKGGNSRTRSGRTAPALAKIEQVWSFSPRPFELLDLTQSILDNISKVPTEDLTPSHMSRLGRIILPYRPFSLPPLRPEQDWSVRCWQLEVGYRRARLLLLGQYPRRGTYAEQQDREQCHRQECMGDRTGSREDRRQRCKQDQEDSDRHRHPSPESQHIAEQI